MVQVCQGRAQLRGEAHVHADGVVQEPNQAGAVFAAPASGGNISALSKHLLPGT